MWKQKLFGDFARESCWEKRKKKSDLVQFSGVGCFDFLSPPVIRVC